MSVGVQKHHNPEMGRRNFCCGEVLPFVVMAFLQCGQVGLSTLFKAAASDGMSYRVFIVYSYALSGLVLLPFAYLFERFGNFTTTTTTANFCFQMAVNTITPCF